MTQAVAFAWRNGVIGIGPKTPKGALPIAVGSGGVLKNAIAGNARLAYDNKTWLVPGVPETTNGDQRVDALIAFATRIQKEVGLSKKRASK